MGTPAPHLTCTLGGKPGEQEAMAVAFGWENSAQYGRMPTTP